MIEGRADATHAPRRRGAPRAAAEPLDALRNMALHYGNAEHLARQAKADNLFDPARNGISAELRLAFLERRPAEFAVDQIRAVRESLERAVIESPDFWSVASEIKLRVLEAVAAQQLAEKSGGLIAAFRDLKARVHVKSMWESVHSGARFTLEPYLGVANTAEKRAARALLEALKAATT